MRGQGKGGVTARGRDFVVIGVPLKKGCHCEGILLREMLSRIERREKGGVRIRRWEVKYSLRVLLYFY